MFANKIMIRSYEQLGDGMDWEEMYGTSESLHVSPLPLVLFLYDEVNKCAFYKDNVWEDNVFYTEDGTNFHLAFSDDNPIDGDYLFLKDKLNSRYVLDREDKTCVFVRNTSTDNGEIAVVYERALESNWFHDNKGKIFVYDSAQKSVSEMFDLELADVVSPTIQEYLSK